MRALVISGGGSKGAFAGGVVEYLINENNAKYDLYIGSSVGSLLIPLISIGEIKRLKQVFTSVSQVDIFSVQPFLIKKVNDQFKTRLNYFGNIKMFLLGRKTFGESDNLRQLIGNIIKPEDFLKMQNNAADVVVTVSNLTSDTIEYKTLKECTYTDFCDWIWASANVVPFMSLVQKNGFEYCDGSMGNIVPIYEAIHRGATEIDVIVFNSGKSESAKPARNAFDLIGRVFGFMLNQIERDDLMLGRIEGFHKNVSFRFFQPSTELTDNNLIFDPLLMTQWWRQGYECAEFNNQKLKLLDSRN